MASAVIVHGGKPHLDDLVFASLMLAENPGIPCYRRDPTTNELNDPEVVVGDVGGRLQPSLNNYDHHQSTALACASHLLNLDLQLGLERLPWWERMSVTDTKGPAATALALGLPHFPWELLSPVEGWLLGMFEGRKAIFPGSFRYEALSLFGLGLLTQAEELARGQAAAQGLPEPILIKGLEVGVISEELPRGAVGEYRKKYPNLAVIISPDDRGPGWSLLRLEDHPRVDFRRVDAGACGFVHAGGFVAKTREMALEEAIILVGQAIE